MSRCWADQESNFLHQENLQGRPSYNENNQKLNTKTYLNPQIVNYEYIRSTLSKGCLKGTNKIHINPNFRGNSISNMTNKNYPHLINSMHLNSQTMSLSEPGTSNTLSVNEETGSVAKQTANRQNSFLFGNDRNSNCTTYHSRFKKINNINLKSSHKSSYSWCNNKTEEVNLNFYSKSQNVAAAVKSVVDKITNYNHNLYKFTSHKVTDDRTCKNSKNRLIFRSKTKIINESKIKLLSNTSLRPKLHFKERRISESLKKHFNLSKSMYDNSKKSSVLKVAKAVRSKYRYLSNSEQYKKTKYKIDKRKKLPENVKKKSNSKEIRDIRKLFPKYSNDKMKISSYNVYNINKCQSISKGRCLLRKNQPVDKVNKNINQFQNIKVVKIGGILYKSTTTKLTLASQKIEISLKKLKSKAKKDCVVYVRGEKFTLEYNGKALKRQYENAVNDKTPLLTPTRIDIGGVTYLRKSSNVLIRTNVHQARRFVNKAKNKSIALLINLHKRSSMPCMIYHRFGRCNRHNKGLCMYKHDPKNIAVCKKFLKGGCSDNNCLLSHQIIQEKMATCHFFLKGLCVKENCPFLHVKLSNNAAICENFVQGFCNLGKECSKRHFHQCPEFDKYGICNFGSKCHYPHKKLKTEESPEQKKTESLCEKLLKPKCESGTVQCYLNSEIQKKQKNKQSVVKLKETHSRKIQKLPTKGLSFNGLDHNSGVIECFPKRIKLDKLPCFIPLNSGS